MKRIYGAAATATGSSRCRTGGPWGKVGLGVTSNGLNFGNLEPQLLLPDCSSCRLVVFGGPVICRFGLTRPCRLAILHTYVASLCGTRPIRYSTYFVTARAAVPTHRILFGHLPWACPEDEKNCRFSSTSRQITDCISPTS